MNNLKNFVAIMAIFLVCSVAQAQESGAVLLKDGPYIEFSASEHNFKDITQGDVVSHTFSFVNSGIAPLILSNVLVTCGCTATEWPREPIMPGDSSAVTVSFDSNGKVGRQNKVVTILSNASNSQERVKIVANILPEREINEY